MDVLLSVSDVNQSPGCEEGFLELMAQYTISGRSLSFVRAFIAKVESVKTAILFSSITFAYLTATIIINFNLLKF